MSGSRRQRTDRPTTRGSSTQATRTTKPNQPTQSTARRGVGVARLVVPIGAALVVLAVLFWPSAGDDQAGSPAGGDTTSAAPVGAQELCDGFDRMSAAHEAFLTQPDPTTVTALRDEAGDLRRLSERATLGEAERSGLGVLLTAYEGLPDDATTEDLDAAAESVPLGGTEDVDAFVTYLESTCLTIP